MGLLFLIGLGLVIYLLTRGSGSKTPNLTIDDQLSQRNREWASFIASYQGGAKTKSEKELIARMLADIGSQGLPTTDLLSQEQADYEPIASTGSEPALSYESTRIANLDTTPAAPAKVNTPIDNATLLLYFGAFLFVASVGLFIAFGGADGFIRTFAVALVMAVMYCSGIWLFHNKPKLRPAGLAFAGIGIAIAPLVGLAAYNYLFKSAPSTVWFVTSLLCLLMYAHALITLRRPPINYIFIFTFLSLFESGVSIASAPIYYFGWALALTGMILKATSRLKGFWPELQESSRTSSQLFLPLAVLVSLVLAPTHGVGQLGVSLLLASIFYGLEAWGSKGTERESNAIVTQIAFLSGVSCLVFAATHSWLAMSTGLLIMNGLQILGLGVVPKDKPIGQNYATILMLAGSTDVLLSIGHPTMIFATTAALVVIGLAIWWTQKIAVAYGLAALAWTALPIIYGQVVAKSPITAAAQAGLLFIALLVQLAVFLLYRANVSSDQWLETARGTYLVAALFVIGAALFAGPITTLSLSLAVGLTLVLLAEQDKETDWSIVAGFAASASLLNSWSRPGIFLASLVIALLFNIILTLRYRQELSRWFSTFLWLLIPLGLGNGALGSHWIPAAYAWAYMVVMAGLIFSRAIARGVIFVSSKIPLTSYAKNASSAYVVGYTVAAVIAVITSLSDVSSQGHTTLVILAIMLAVYILSTRVEKRADLSTLLPLLAQFFLWSAIRPALGESTMTGFLLASTTIAVGGYYLSTIFEPEDDQKNHHSYIKDASLISVFITPSATLIAGQTIWPMPLGLLIAGCLVYDYVRNNSQEYRELAVGIIMLSVLWFMWLAGIRETQAYTHVIALTFAGYAYWRALRKETEESDNYLMLMLATATIPLAIQAIAGVSGGLYGWWLLLEQIVFMLLGMAIRKRFVIFWGLYVAIGSVLYQLRHLGWAALTVLAIFIICLAVYQLQRHNQSGPE